MPHIAFEWASDDMCKPTVKSSEPLPNEFQLAIAGLELMEMAQCKRLERMVRIFGKPVQPNPIVNTILEPQRAKIVSSITNEPYPPGP